jgi:hypothetical protein
MVIVNCARENVKPTRESLAQFGGIRQIEAPTTDYESTMVAGGESKRPKQERGNFE